MQTLNIFLGAAFFLSEAALSTARRARGNDAPTDRGTLQLLWWVIPAGVWLAFFAARLLPSERLAIPGITSVGLGLFVVGATLRWSAVLVLGRFFTVNLAILPGHQVVTRGPYKILRHPAYSGALLMFAGLGLRLDNLVSLIVILVPAAAAFLWRIAIEERLLLTVFGEDYQRYMQRTWRLVPYVY